MANWMYDYEERTAERNERVYKLIMERKEKEENQASQDKSVNREKCEHYDNSMQKLLWDEQNLLTK